MRKHVEENERMKQRYVFHLEQADGLDQKSTDKVLAAILKFEQSTGFKPFKRFHIDQAAKFKTTLSQAKKPTRATLEPFDNRRHADTGAQVLSLAGGAERL